MIQVFDYLSLSGGTITMGLIDLIEVLQESKLITNTLYFRTLIDIEIIERPILLDNKTTRYLQDLIMNNLQDKTSLHTDSMYEKVNESLDIEVEDNVYSVVYYIDLYNFGSNYRSRRL